MQSVLKEGFNNLESCFKLQDRVDNFERIKNSEIYSTLKKKIRFKRKVEKEGNFSYICYEISNFDKLFNGELEIIHKMSKFYKTGYMNHLILVNKYILLYNKTVFILTVVQPFHNIAIYNSEKKLLFDLPVFFSNEVCVWIIENGVERTLIDKFCNLEKELNINSIYIKQAIKDYSIKVSGSERDNIKIYYDEKLEIEKNGSEENHIIIRQYLRDKYYSGYITEKDFTFNQRLEKKSYDNVEDVTIALKYKDLQNVREQKFFNTMTSITEKKDTLTNDSKIKIEITIKKSSLSDNELNLSDFLYNIILKNESLYIDVTDSKYSYETYSDTMFESLLDKNGKEINDTYITDDNKNISVRYNNFGNICYPDSQINICRESFKHEYINNFEQELLNEKVSYDTKKSSILLTQHYLITLYDNCNVSKYIFRLVFAFKKISFNHIGKVFTFVIPYLLNNDLYKMKIFDYETINLIKEHTCNTDISCYLEQISCLKTLENKLDINRRCIPQMYPEINRLECLRSLYNDTLFTDKSITFFEKVREPRFDVSDVNIKYDANLCEYFEEILAHYNITLEQ